MLEGLAAAKEAERQERGRRVGKGEKPTRGERGGRQAGAGAGRRTAQIRGSPNETGVGVCSATNFLKPLRTDLCIGR